MTDSTHLSETDARLLGAGLLDRAAVEAGRAHADRCRSCAELVAAGAASAGLHGSGAEARINLGAAPIPSRIAEALQAGRKPAPSAGQLWCLTRGQAAATAVIVDQLEDMLIVVPATFDPEMADEYTLSVPPERSPVDQPLALWAAERTAVPVETLDTYLGDLGNLDELDAAHGAYREDRPYTGAATGPPVYAPFDPRWDYRHELRDRFVALAAVGRAWDADTQHEPAQALVAAVSMRLQQAGFHTREDLHAKEIAPAVAPLGPVGIVQIADVSVRVCVAEGIPDLERLPDVASAVDLLALLRDSEYVAVVADTETLDTAVFDAWHLHQAYVTPDSVDLHGPWRSPGPLPLVDAFTSLREQLKPPRLPPLAEGGIGTPVFDMEEVAAARAGEALHDQKKVRARLSDKKEALAELADAEAHALRQLVLEAHRGHPIHMDDRMDELVGITP